MTHISGLEGVTSINAWDPDGESLHDLAFPVSFVTRIPVSPSEL